MCQGCTDCPFLISPNSLSFYPLSLSLSYLFHHPGTKEASQETKVSSREEQTQGLAQDDPPQETEHTTTYTAGILLTTAILLGVEALGKNLHAWRR